MALLLIEHCTNGVTARTSTDCRKQDLLQRLKWKPMEWMLLKLLSCVIWLLTFFAKLQSTLRPFCQHIRTNSFQYLARRAVSAERSYVRGPWIHRSSVSLPDRFASMLFDHKRLLYFVSGTGHTETVWAGKSLRLPNILYRIFGIHTWFRRLDIKQRLQAGFDRFSTFGESVPNVAAKAQRSMKGYQRPLQDGSWWIYQLTYKNTLICLRQKKESTQHTNMQLLEQQAQASKNLALQMSDVSFLAAVTKLTAAGTC